MLEDRNKNTSHKGGGEYDSVMTEFLFIIFIWVLMFTLQIINKRKEAKTRTWRKEGDVRWKHLSVNYANKEYGQQWMVLCQFVARRK